MLVFLQAISKKQFFIVYSSANVMWPQVSVMYTNNRRSNIGHNAYTVVIRLFFNYEF